jgi:hypothetical protein
VSENVLAGDPEVVHQVVGGDIVGDHEHRQAQACRDQERLDQ